MQSLFRLLTTYSPLLIAYKGKTEKRMPSHFLFENTIGGDWPSSFTGLKSDTVRSLLWFGLGFFWLVCLFVKWWWKNNKQRFEKCQIINSTAESVTDAVVLVTEANMSYNCFRHTWTIVFTSILVQFLFTQNSK